MDLANGLWRVLESLKAGKRLPEARFANLRLAHSSQHSIYGMYKKECSDTSAR
jgi:hypothetical protein